MGVIWLMTRSFVSFSLTMFPRFTERSPVLPSMGDRRKQYPSFTRLCSTWAASACTVASSAPRLAITWSYCCLGIRSFSISRAYRFTSFSAFSLSATSFASVASATCSATWNGTGSISNRRSPLFTSWPSRKATLLICPATRVLIVTVENASTVPMARTWTGKSFLAAVPTVTGTPVCFAPVIMELVSWEHGERTRGPATRTDNRAARDRRPNHRYGRKKRDPRIIGSSPHRPQESDRGNAGIVERLDDVCLGPGHLHLRVDHLDDVSRTHFVPFPREAQVFPGRLLLLPAGFKALGGLPDGEGRLLHLEPDQPPKVRAGVSRRIEGGLRLLDLFPREESLEEGELEQYGDVVVLFQGEIFRGVPVPAGPREDGKVVGAGRAKPEFRRPLPLPDRAQFRAIRLRLGDPRVEIPRNRNRGEGIREAEILRSVDSHPVQEGDPRHLKVVLGGGPFGAGLVEVRFRAGDVDPGPDPRLVEGLRLGKERLALRKRLAADVDDPLGTENSEIGDFRREGDILPGRFSAFRGGRDERPGTVCAGPCAAEVREDLGNGAFDKQGGAGCVLIGRGGKRPGAGISGGKADRRIISRFGLPLSRDGRRRFGVGLADQGMPGKSDRYDVVHVPEDSGTGGVVVPARCALPTGSCGRRGNTRRRFLRPAGQMPQP